MGRSPPWVDEYGTGSGSDRGPAVNKACQFDFFAIDQILLSCVLETLPENVQDWHYMVRDVRGALILKEDHEKDFIFHWSFANSGLK